MSDVKFKLKAVEKKPPRKYRRGSSKYDPIIDAFIEGTDNFVEVSVAGKNANYLRTQLDKRVKVRDLEKKMDVSVINGVCHLEKI